MNIKLLNQDMTSQYGNHTWEIGKLYSVKGKLKMCENGFHFYRDSNKYNGLIAQLFNPIHADISSPRGFIFEPSWFIIDEKDKSISQKAKIIEEIELCAISEVQRIAFAIFCGKKVEHNEAWVKWADNWLNGIDRSRNLATVTWLSNQQAAGWAAAAAAGWEAVQRVAYSAFSAAQLAAVLGIKDFDIIAIAEKAMEYK